MNTFKSFGLVGLAAAGLLLAGQAFATTCPVSSIGVQTQPGPVCIAPYGLDGQGTGLQDVLGPSSNPNSIFATGPGIDPYTQQVQMPYWSVNGQTGSVATILLQIAGNANADTFGIFDPNNINNKLAILTNGSNGDQALLNVYVNGGYSVNFGTKVTFSTTNYFGYYLTSGGTTFYSLPSANSDGIAHMVAFEGNGSSTYKEANGLPGGNFGANEYILAWEDQLAGVSDLDYNDFIVQVESVHPVPEPAVLGMFGLGLLLIGAGVAFRRRQHQV